MLFTGEAALRSLPARDRAESVGADQSLLGRVLRGMQGGVQAACQLPGGESSRLPAKDLYAVEGAPGGGDAAPTKCRAAAQNQRQSHTEEMEDCQAFPLRP